MAILKDKKVIIIGDRDGIPGPARSPNASLSVRRTGHLPPALADR